MSEQFADFVIILRDLKQAPMEWRQIQDFTGQMNSQTLFAGCWAQELKLNCLFGIKQPRRALTAKALIPQSTTSPKSLAMSCHVDGF